MTLRTKTLAAIGATFIGLLAILHLSSREILLRSFGELEERSMKRDVQRGADALQNAVLGIHSKTGDWANWDDAYAFLETQDPAFVVSNLTDQAFVDLKLHLLLIVDLSGQIIAGKAVDYRSEPATEMTFPAAFLDGRAPEELVLQPGSDDDGLKGILLLPEGPLMVSARPVRTSAGEGPTRGTVIMGRFLDAPEVARLSGLTHLCLVVHRLDEPSMPGTLRAADTALSDAKPILVEPANTDSILGYARLADISDKPALLLQVVAPREIYKQGVLSVQSLFLAVALVGLVFGGLTILLVERLVLARVARLSAGVREIGAKSDFTARLAFAGADELASLAGTVNGLLAAVEASESALSKSQRSLATLMGNLQGVAYRCRMDRDWTMEFVSEGCLELTGYRSCDLIEGGTTPFGQVIHPDDRQRVWDEVQQALREKRPFQLNYRIVTATGEEKWVWEQGRAILAPDGTTEALEGLMVDVTDRKRLEEALRAANDYNRSLIEANLDPIVTIDPKGTITDLNSALQILTGHFRDELIGTDFASYFTDREQARAVYQQAFQDGAVRDCALEVRHWDRHTTPVLCNAAVYHNHAGNALGVCVAVRDVTERKLVEAELRQAREAAHAASTAKSEFLANMSHEIRTPMTAILGYVDLLADGCLGTCAFGRDTLQRHIETITRNAKYLLQLINDILDLSKIEAGKLQPEIGSCSPSELLADLESLMRVRATSKKLSLNIECPGPIPESIQTDPVRLRQILINLLGNALKFTDAGGVRFVLRLVHAEQGDRPAEPYLQFDVIDTGPGLTSEQIGLLFRPFSQADGSINRRFGGTGLGLSISQRLAGMLGGRVTVESTPGEGSTFHVVVATGPLDGVRLVEYNPTALPVRASKPAGDPTLAGRILLAEDGPDNQRLISFLLRRAGAEVTAVDNGQLAVDAALAALAAGQPFDIILMDMQMPVLDGYAATTRLRQRGYTGTIVALTAHAMSSDRADCLAAGCDDFATKPIDRSKLLGLVAGHLRKAHAMSPASVSPEADARPLTEQLRTFLTGLPDVLSTLQRHWAENDLANLSALADRLQGTAGGCGLGPITECARKLSEAAHASGDLNALEPIVRDLVSLCQATRLQSPAPATPHADAEPVRPG